MAFITPSDWSLGVEGTLAVRILPPPSATRSVKVPPTSTPRRRSFTRSSLLLGDQLPFRGFLLVDVLAVGLGCQGVAHDAERADGGDVDGDQERAPRGVEGCGDDRCQGAAEDARDLVAEGRTGIAHACAEELSVEACLYAVHGGVSQCEPDHPYVLGEPEVGGYVIERVEGEYVEGRVYADAGAHTNGHVLRVRLEHV